MAFWNSEMLKDRIAKGELIVPYDPERVKHSAYEMGVGNEAFVTSKSSDNPLLDTGSQIEIPPGQFGLHITAEVVTIPPDAIGFISIRAGIKFRGLVNVSGFHVDPGFKGKLKFAVYNAGSQTIRLDQEQPVFMLWFCDLVDPERPEGLYKNRPPGINVITADDVSKIQGEVASPAELKKRIDELQIGYDQKILAIEKEQNIVRGLLIAIVLAVVGVWIRDLVHSKKGDDSPHAAKSVSLAKNEKPQGESVIQVHQTSPAKETPPANKSSAASPQPSVPKK